MTGAATVSITVDVDGEAGLPDGGAGWEHRLTSRSERAYGLRRGLPRVLDALARHHARATFYVPGATADAAPDEVREILARGHEVAHHGDRHLRTDALDAAGETAELEDGIAALRAVADVRPEGYRSPGWELTPRTLALLGSLGFRYDSSLMGDDRPYRIRAGGTELVELPVHWSLDDAPHFAATVDPSGLLSVWLAELDLAAGEDRHLTFTLHPEILGRPHRIAVLHRVLERAARLGVAALAHRDVAARVAPALRSSTPTAPAATAQAPPAASSP